MADTHRALILGVTGQDGALLAARLLADGWKVYGGFRRGHSTKLWRLEELEITDKITLVNINLHEPHQLIEAVKDVQPDQIYHLAGESFVADSFHQARSVMETNVLGTLNVLEAVRICAPTARMFFASSAEIFGAPNSDALLDENTPFRPANPYALSKLTAHHLVEIHRRRHDLFGVNGIMFNHEGPLRARNFVTRKITYNLARLKIDGGPPMKLGDMNAARDWGAAADYATAMPLTLGLTEPGDFVFATGKRTTVREFLDLAGRAAGFAPAFEGEGNTMTCRDAKSGLPLAVVSDRYFRPHDTPPLIGNPSRLKAATRFTGSREIAKIAEEMVRTDLERRKKGKVHV